MSSSSETANANRRIAAPFEPVVGAVVVEWIDISCSSWVTRGARSSLIASPTLRARGVPGRCPDLVGGRRTGEPHRGADPPRPGCLRARRADEPSRLRVVTNRACLVSDMATTIETPIVRLVCCAGVCAVLVVVSWLAGAPGTALAGGDEGHAPPGAGPPGPWQDREVGEGEDLPYRPTDARSCRLRGVRGAGPGSVLGLWAVRTSCRTAARVVRRYQRCLNSEIGREPWLLQAGGHALRPTGVPGALLDARPFLPAACERLSLHRAAAVRGREHLRGSA